MRSTGVYKAAILPVHRLLGRPVKSKCKASNELSGIQTAQTIFWIENANPIREQVGREKIAVVHFRRGEGHEAHRRRGAG